MKDSRGDAEKDEPVGGIEGGGECTRVMKSPCVDARARVYVCV